MILQRREYSVFLKVYPMFILLVTAFLAHGISLSTNPSYFYLKRKVFTRVCFVVSFRGYCECCLLLAVLYLSSDFFLAFAYG